MLHTPTVVLIIFLLTVVMIMSGRGGGNFYVIALVLSGVPIHAASTTSQFILFASALSGALVFGKAGTMSWPLAFTFGGLNSLAAFVGGFEAHRFTGTTLKIVLSIALGIAGVAMLFPQKELPKASTSRLGYWSITKGKNRYVVNVWLAAPFTLATGFFSGMVGISGGSFLVPLMVAGCGVPMHIAVGTMTAILTATALTGFLGHAFHGGFDSALAVPCGVVAILGGVLGGRIALKAKPNQLRIIYSVITIIASVVMMVNALA